MIAGVVFAIAGFGLYVWDTRGSKLFTSNNQTPSNPVTVNSSDSDSQGGSRRRRIKQKNTRKRSYKN
jgi:hypothetical protein